MIISLSEAKTLLEITVTDYDDIITDMLNAITSMFEKVSGRHFEQATITEVLNGEGRRTFYLQEIPVSITTVHVSDSQTWDSGSLIDSSDYRQDHTAVHRLGGNTWLRGFQNIQVVYEVGYADVSASAPDVWWAAQKSIQKMWSTYRAELGKDIDINESYNKNDLDLKFRAPTFLDAEILEILRQNQPWPE